MLDGWKSPSVRRKTAITALLPAVARSDTTCCASSTVTPLASAHDQISTLTVIRMVVRPSGWSGAVGPVGKIPGGKPLPAPGAARGLPGGGGLRREPRADALLANNLVPKNPPRFVHFVGKGGKDPLTAADRDGQQALDVDVRIGQ